MQIAIFLICCAILGVSIVVCLELRHLREDIWSESRNLEERIIWLEYNIFNDVTDTIIDHIPNTFEYNGNKGKVYRK